MANPSLGTAEFLVEHRNTQEWRNTMHEKQDFEPAMKVSAESCLAQQLASKAMPSALKAPFEPPSTTNRWKCYWSLALAARGHNSASRDICIQDVHFHFKKWNHFVDFSSGTARHNPVVAAATEIEGKVLPGSRSCETGASGPFCVKKMKMS